MNLALVDNLRDLAVYSDNFDEPSCVDLMIIGLFRFYWV